MNYSFIPRCMSGGQNRWIMREGFQGSHPELNSMLPIKNQLARSPLFGMRDIFSFRDDLGNKIHAWIFWLGLISIYLLGWYIQSTILLNRDVSWLMHATKRLLSGGSYAHDFFEINPPMILYLYLPPVLFAKFFAINIILALRIYIFALSSLSLFFCYRLARTIFAGEKKIILYLFLLAVAFMAIIAPVYEFGQREHLLMLFTLPYFLLSTARLQKESISLKLAIAVGIFAACGFALKPYFFMIFCVVEIYLAYVKRSLSFWVKPEVIAVLLFHLLYVTSIFIFHTDYFLVVIPIAMKIYYSSMTSSWQDLFFYPLILYCILVYLCSAVVALRPYHFLNRIISIAWIGFLLIYFFQRNLWYYHFYPVFFLTILLLTLLSCSLIQISQSKKDYLWIALAITIAFIYPCYFLMDVYLGSLSIKDKMQPFIRFIHTYAKNQSVYFIGTTTVMEFPAVDYASALPASRFTLQSWVPTVLKNNNTAIKNYFIDIIAEELNANKPTLVFIDVQENKPYLENVKIDYLNFFATNQHFQRAWVQYSYFKTLQENNMYKFMVYRRETT